MNHKTQKAIVITLLCFFYKFLSSHILFPVCSCKLEKCASKLSIQDLDDKFYNSSSYQRFFIQACGVISKQNDLN